MASTDDSDSDGAPNFLEYALDLNPSVDDAIPLQVEDFQIETGLNLARLHYQRYRATQGIQFQVLYKQHLSDVQWTAVGGADRDCIA